MYKEDQKLELKVELTKDIKKEIVAFANTNDGTIYIDEEKKYSDDGYVPDWEFMSKYMEEIDGKAQQRIDLLRTIGC